MNKINYKMFLSIVLLSEHKDLNKTEDKKIRKKNIKISKYLSNCSVDMCPRKLWKFFVYLVPSYLTMIVVLRNKLCQ